MLEEMNVVVQSGLLCLTKEGIQLLVPVLLPWTLVLGTEGLW